MIMSSMLNVILYVRIVSKVNMLVKIYCRCDICHFKFYMIQLYPGVVAVDIYNHVA